MLNLIGEGISKNFEKINNFKGHFHEVKRETRKVQFSEKFIWTLTFKTELVLKLMFHFVNEGLNELSLVLFYEQKRISWVLELQSWNNFHISVQSEYYIFAFFNILGILIYITKIYAYVFLFFPLNHKRNIYFIQELSIMVLVSSKNCIKKIGILNTAF